MDGAALFKCHDVNSALAIRTYSTRMGMTKKIPFNKIRSQSYQTLISLLFRLTLLSLAILMYNQYFLMLQTLKLNNEKWKNSSYYEEKVW
jgi:hypothetical protein